MPNPTFNHSLRKASDLVLSCDGAWPINNRFDDRSTLSLYDEGLGSHEGIDWECPTGTPVHAMAAGTVVAIPTYNPRPQGPAEKDRDYRAYLAQNGFAYGRAVVIDTIDPSGPAGNKDATISFRHLYAHLLEVSVGKDQVVAQGERIGKSGSTGNSSGPHLHVYLKPFKDTGRSTGQYQRDSHYHRYPEGYDPRPNPARDAGAHPRAMISGTVDFVCYLPSEAPPGAGPCPYTASPGPKVGTIPGNTVACYPIVGMIPEPAAVGPETMVWWHIQYDAQTQGWVSAYLDQDPARGVAVRIHNGISLLGPSLKIDASLGLNVRSEPRTGADKQTKLDESDTWYAIVGQYPNGVAPYVQWWQIRYDGPREG